MWIEFPLVGISIIKFPSLISFNIEQRVFTVGIFGQSGLIWFFFIAMRYILCGEGYNSFFFHIIAIYIMSLFIELQK
jgi:hypothetical protein